MSDLTTEQEAKIRELEEKLNTALQEKFKPGEWQCVKCHYRLHKRFLSLLDGGVGVDATITKELCPNDGTQLRPVIWEQEAKEASWMKKRRNVRCAGR